MTKDKLRWYVAEPNPPSSLYTGWRVMRLTKGEGHIEYVSRYCEEWEAKVIAEALNDAWLMGKDKDA